MNKILSMAALALIMAGCSNDNDNVEIDNGQAINAVPIQISQKVAGVETKAAVTPGSKMQANIIMVDAGTNDADNPDLSAFSPKTENTLTDKSGSTSGEKELANDAARANVANTEFTASATAGQMTLNPKLYYPVESGSTKTWLYGISPLGAVDATKVTFKDVDGLQDVMYAGKTAAGSKDTPESNIALTFEHKTTQLLFVSKLANADLTGTEWAGKTVSVKSIIVQKAQVPTTMKISDGSMEYKEMSLTVAGCKEALTATPCAKSVPIMIKEAASVVVDLVLTVGNETLTYSNLTVQNSATGQSGNLATKVAKSHLITFEITPPVEAVGATKITTSAKIVDWTEGDTGKVEIK